MTFAHLRRYLDGCRDDDLVVVFATLDDGSVLSVRELDVGTDHGGNDGEGVEVVIQP